MLVCFSISENSKIRGSLPRLRLIGAENSSFIDNRAKAGGGVAHSFAMLNITRCLFAGNRADAGGAFYLGAGVRGPGGLVGLLHAGFIHNRAIMTPPAYTRIFITLNY